MNNPMSEPAFHEPIPGLEPVHSEDSGRVEARWTNRLVFFLRVMAAISLFKGLYHWSRVCGILAGPD